MKLAFYLSLMLLSLWSCKKETTETLKLAEEGLVGINGTSLYVRSIGEGEPILIVHGGPGLGSSYLYEYFDRLGDEYQVIYYDQRLAGKSLAHVDSTALGFQKFIDDVDSIRAHFGFKTFHILGHSWGGLIAMKYAARWPQRINGLSLISSIGASSEINRKANESMAQLFTKEDLEARLQIMQSEAFINKQSSAYEALMMLGFRKQFHNEILAQELKLNLPSDFSERSAQLRHMHGLEEYDFHRDLWNIMLPVFVAYGYHDPLRVYALQSLKEALPSTRVHVFDDCGHFPFIDCPDIFFKELRDYLSHL